VANGGRRDQGAVHSTVSSVNDASLLTRVSGSTISHALVTQGTGSNDTFPRGVNEIAKDSYLKEEKSAGADKKKDSVRTGAWDEGANESGMRSSEWRMDVNG